MYDTKAARHFDQLPDEALIRIKLLREFLPISVSSIWRLSKTRRFPAPVKVSSQITAFRVGQIRQWLADPQGYKAKV